MAEIDEKQIHRMLAAKLFNQTWELIEKAERTPREDETMIHRAHAARYHWEVSVEHGLGTARNVATSDWQCSRAYAMLQRAESALHYGLASLRLCEENHLTHSALAWAHEALARAYGQLGDRVGFEKHLKAGLAAASAVEKAEDREWVLKNLDTVALREGDAPFEVKIPSWE